FVQFALVFLAGFVYVIGFNLALTLDGNKAFSVSIAFAAKVIISSAVTPLVFWFLNKMTAYILPAQQSPELSLAKYQRKSHL
ncbi:hypothetical protein, partial [Candidatus Endomicrobiellum agilis]|uniref:hypothetical protein n=1 Tax=Candidatus Endomicrobiellum agilis TaxID=3238957 RepID=UPI0035736AB6|nr:hypothetical protein [Endomicrobium sp.]